MRRGALLLLFASLRACFAADFQDEVVGALLSPNAATHCPQVLTLTFPSDTCAARASHMAEGSFVWRNKYAIGGTIAGGAVVVALPAVLLPAAGFGAAGVISGSWAAASMGPAVAAGGWFAFAQSLAVTGFAAPTTFALVAVPAAAGVVLDTRNAAPCKTI